MVIFDGEQPFESFYLKHFDTLQDLQNCTECFKNLSIYSSSIYYQVSQSNTGSFKRILTENDEWLDDTFWKNGGNYMKSPFSLGTLNSNPISFIVSGSEKMLITNDGIGINISPSYSLDINGNVRIYQNSLYVTSVGSVGGIIDYTRYLSVNGSTGTNGQFLKRTFSGNGWNNITIGDVTGLSTYTSSMNIWTGSVSSSLNSLNLYTSSINSLTGSYFKQGGNSFGTSGSLGTNDNNNLSFLTSGSNRIIISSFGNVSISKSLDITQNLTINGETSILSTLYDASLSAGSTNQFLRSNNTSGVQWTTIQIPHISGLANFTSSVSSSLNSLNNYTSSNNVVINNFSVYSSSMNIYTGSLNTTINLLNISTGSLNSYTSSNNTSITNLNQVSSSFKTYTSSLNIWTGSISSSLNSLNSYTSSNNTSITNLNTFTSSINSLTGSYFKQGGNSFGQSGSIGTLDNNNLHLITSGSTRIFVSSSGAIGLGTLTPISSYLITANGNTLISNGRFGTDALGINIFNYSGVSPRISSDSTLEYLATSTHRWYRSGDLHMMSLNSTGLRISSTFSTASYALDVQGTIGLSGIIYVGNTSYGLPLSSGSDGQFLKRSNYLGSFVLNTWDNILTSDVTGLNIFTGSVNTSLLSLNSNTGSYFKQGGNSFGTSGSFGTLDNNNLRIITNNLIRTFVSSSGLIGINRIDPSYILDISGSFRTTDITYLSTTSGKVIVNGTTDNGYNLDVNGTLRNTTSAYFATTGGNVGIGTTTSNAPLQFANTVQNRKLVLYEGTNNDHDYYGFGINSGILRYQSASNHVFYSHLNSTTSNQLLSINSDQTVTYTPLTTSQINALTKVKGKMAYNFDTDKPVWCNGTVWKYADATNM